MIHDGCIQVVHVFAVEKSKLKQKFILGNHNPCILFADIMQLGHKTAWDVRSQSMVAIPSADIVVVGLSCKLFSALRQVRPEDVLRDRKGSSGETYGGFVDFLREHLPRLALLENVPAMLKGKRGARNLAEIKRMAAELGYTVVWCKFNAVDYGLPQCRTRVYLALHYRCSSGFAEEFVSGARDMLRAFKVPPFISCRQDALEATVG